MNYLCDKRVIWREIKCPRCGNILNCEFEDSLIFHCTHKYYKIIRKKKRQRIICNFMLSPLHGTWFENFRLGFQKVCRFIGYFIMLKRPHQTFLELELEMSSTSVVDWMNFCREVNNNIFKKTVPTTMT